MPYLTVYTNAKIADGKKLAEDASMLVAEVLHKPAGYVVANFIYNEAMAFGAKAENKGALAELKSIGLGDKSRFVSELTSFLATRLGITELQYINIALTDSPASQTACAGRTFG